MDLLGTTRRRFVRPGHAVALDPMTTATAALELLRRFRRYRRARNPDGATRAKVAITVHRLYRAGLGSPAMLDAMMAEARIYLERLAKEPASRTLTPDLSGVASRYLCDAAWRTQLANVLSFVIPYAQGVQLTPDTTGRVAGLRAAARAARQVVGPLRRLHEQRLCAAYSVHLRDLGELAAWDVAGEAPPAGPAVPSADAFLRGSAQGRQLDRLELLREVLVGMEAVALAHDNAGQAGLAARGRDVRAVARQLRALRLAMGALDDRELAGLLPQRVLKNCTPLAALASLLERFADAAQLAAQTLQPPIGRPPAPDPLQLGVEQLAMLWQRAHGVVPPATNNVGSFADLCLTLLGPPGLGFAASAVIGRVRGVVHALPRAAPGSHPPAGE